MPRKKPVEKTVPSDSEAFLPVKMDIDPQAYVVQANDIIFGMQALGPTEAKLLRLCIAQNVESGDFFKPYQITVPELAKILGVLPKYLYRDLEGICEGIIQKPLKMYKDGSWVMYPWVSICKYDDKTHMVHIQLNDAMKPFLLNLKESGIYSTKYTLSNVIQYKSSYSIRIFEMLLARMNGGYIYGNEVKTITLTTNEIRCACDCTDRYLNPGDLGSKVIVRAIKEINQLSPYKIDVTPVKDSTRHIQAYQFTISNRYQSSEA